MTDEAPIVWWHSGSLYKYRPVGVNGVCKVVNLRMVAVAALTISRPSFISLSRW